MYRKLIVLAALALPAAACNENVGVETGAPLDVVFQTNAGHIHIYESPVTYTAAVTTTGDTKRVVADFDTMRVEFAAVGTSTWTRLGDLAFQSASNTYSSVLYWPVAGTFNYRLVGHRPGDAGVQVLSAPTGTSAPVRQHFDVTGTTWRVEFEPSPGITKPGDNVTMKFYVMQAAANPDGTRTPVTGLQANLTITCINPGATTGTDKAVTESAGGTYSAICTVPMSGWAKAKLNFTSGAPSQTGIYGVGAYTGAPS